jgi:23S rRNA pseudouridine2605 synthase
LWELASARYTKQIKAGANAGQPSALSALISLYLGQVALAAEDEIEIFLSPLAPRSRIRDVTHALTAARELDTVAIEGRTMLHIAGEAPEFLTPGQPESQGQTARGESEIPEETQNADAAEAGAGERIKKFVPKPRKVGTGYLAKGAPAKRAAKPFGKERGARSERPAFGRPDRPARGDKPAFGKPERRTSGERPAFGRPERGGRGERPAFGGSDRRAAGPRFEGKPDRERRPFQKSRPEGDAKPRFDRPWNEDRPKRPARRDEERGSFAGPRETSDRPRAARDAHGGEGGGWKPAFRGKDKPQGGGFREGAQRPPRREGGFAPRGDRSDRFAKGPDAAKRPFRRTAGPAAGGQREGERQERPFRRFDAPSGGKRPFTPRSEHGGTGDRAARPFRPRTDRPAAGGGENRGPREFGGDRRPAKFASKFAGKRPAPRGEGGFSSRPRPAGRAGDRPFGGKGTSGRSPAKRTFKRKEDESA